ncbi:MAG: hypothetical protein AAGA75_09040 [Cyanobacteria bacterium P01_E01_bin.6]
MPAFTLDDALKRLAEPEKEPLVLEAKGIRITIPRKGHVSVAELMSATAIASSLDNARSSYSLMMLISRSVLEHQDSSGKWKLVQAEWSSDHLEQLPTGWVKEISEFTNGELTEWKEPEEGKGGESSGEVQDPSTSSESG